MFVFTFFSLPLIFTLVVTSTFHLLTAAFFHAFLLTNLVSFVLISLSLSSSFSVIQVNVYIKSQSKQRMHSFATYAYSRAQCHNTAFIFVTYDPQITHGKQIVNRKTIFLEKQGTLCQTNRPLSSSKNPHFQNKAKCTTSLVKMRFIC